MEKGNHGISSKSVDEDNICPLCNLIHGSDEELKLFNLTEKVIFHLEEVYKPGHFLLLGDNNGARKICPVAAVKIYKADEDCKVRAITIPRLDDSPCAAVYVELYNEDYWLGAEAISVFDAALKYDWRVENTEKWFEKASEVMQQQYLQAIEEIASNMTPQNRKLAIVEFLAFFKKK
ncbi:MAG: hypothetical protein WC349_03760 [Patescibacteria group bacterium]|jgi:hypothetical protein